MPCCSLLEGQYGIEDTWVGVPVILGSDGVEKIIEVELSSAESEALQASAAAVHDGQTEVAQMINIT